MKSLLFKQQIWQGKQKALATYGEAVTRRLNGLQEINKEPDRWEYMRTNNDGKALFWVVANDPEPDSYKRIRLILSPFQSGEIVYLREAYYQYGEWEIVSKAKRLKNGYYPTRFIPIGKEVIFLDTPQEKLPPNLRGNTALIDKSPFGAVCDVPIYALRSPYAMSEALARTFFRIKDVRPERLEINKLSVHEIELEGGETALAFLNDYEGFWVWRISFEKSKQEKSDE